MDPVQDPLRSPGPKVSSDDGGDDAAPAPRDIGPEARLEVLAQRVLGMRHVCVLHAHVHVHVHVYAKVQCACGVHVHTQWCSVHAVYTRCVGEMCAGN